MESMMEFLTTMNAVHWLAIGLVLIAIEMAVGTFDLLWIGAAALLTALVYAGVLPLPEAMTSWQGQLVTFSVLATALVILGRTAFNGLRKPSTTHPSLNQRANSLVGQRAQVATAFAAGSGRVKVGDTTWSAESENGEDFAPGDTVVVASADSTVLRVRRA